MAQNRLNKTDKTVIGVNINIEVRDALDRIGENLNSSRSQLINQIVEATIKGNIDALKLYQKMAI